MTKLRAPAMPSAGAWTGEVARIDDEGRVFVRTAGQGEQLAVLLNAAALAADLVPGARVLLLANPDDAELPIVAGVLETRIPKRPGSRVCEVNGRKLLLTAEEEIRLTCGRSTIVLTRDGRVTVRGARVVTRAAETNRVKGGTVEIN